MGIVKARRGRSYIIEVAEGNQTRTVIARPEHIE
jgi:ribosomal protein L21E